MKRIFTLIKKDYLIDTRQKYPIAGIVLYIFCTIYISYLSFQSVINTTTWNALYWIILLFSSITGIARSFMQEESRNLYYYFLTKPEKIFFAKLLYSYCYQAVLLAITLLLFNLFVPIDRELELLFFINLGLGALGLANSFTLISSLASKSENQSTMMAILGFPVIIPVLLLAVTNSKKILLGAGWDDISGNSLTLISLNVIIFAASVILFPYSWKN